MSIRENTRIELKRELTKGLEQEAIAFLNYHEGGVIYVGIDDLGTVVGVKDADGDMLKIKDRLKNNILPSVMGLFDVGSEKHDGKDVIKITLASGPEKPYYIKKEGMSERGVFIRVGTAAEPMTTRMIENLFAKRTRNSLGKIQSPRQDLSFKQLKIYYEEANKELNEQFATNLELLTEESKYNYVAYLLADVNGNSIKVAKYSGLDRVFLSENDEYGYCSLLKATEKVLDRIKVENITSAIIAYPKRIERQRWDYLAIREAVINAILHNDYTLEVPPKFEFFDDRFEITSYGGLVPGMSKEEFFTGFSMPRNKELMRVFRDLDMVEQLGSGVPRILKSYGKECFTFSENFLRMSFPVFKALPPQVEVTPQVTPQVEDQMTPRVPSRVAPRVEVTPQVTPQVPSKVKVTPQIINRVTPRVRDQIIDQVTPQVKDLLRVLDTAMEREKIQLLLGLSDRKHFRIAYLVPALNMGFIEMTIPDKPNSRMQKYRLTTLGELLKKEL